MEINSETFFFQNCVFVFFRESSFRRDKNSGDKCSSVLVGGGQSSVVVVVAGGFRSHISASLEFLSCSNNNGIPGIPGRKFSTTPSPPFPFVVVSQAETTQPPNLSPDILDNPKNVYNNKIYTE